MKANYVDIEGTSYCYDRSIEQLVSLLHDRVSKLRETGRLSPEALKHIRKFFRIKNIHHSIAIEGSRLSYGETELVVEQGLTISGKPLRDSLEAKNLSHALDFFESLATRTDEPITMHDIRQIHQAIMKDTDRENAGKYRQGDVQITGSGFKPPPYLHVPGKLEVFEKWVKSTSAPGTSLSVDPVILAAVAHSWFVYIHPFADGNGRTARILMNLILMRYGYPISIITRDDRQRYYDALEESQSSDLTPFISLLCDSVSESLDQYEQAVSEQRETLEWARSLMARVEERELGIIQGQFEVWRSAMELMKGYFKQVVDQLNEQGSLTKIFFKGYDILDFEKYLSLRHEQSAKRTWFIKMDFSVGDQHVRYLFFFGYASSMMKRKISDSDNVTVHIAREEEPFYYERLDSITASPVPNIREIAYSRDEETFICRIRRDEFQEQKVEALARNFITDVMEIPF